MLAQYLALGFFFFLACDFLAFIDIFPKWILILIIYREFLSIYVRHELIVLKHVLAANFLGKLKTVFYSFSCALGLLLLTLQRIEWGDRYYNSLYQFAYVVFLITLILSIASIVVYLFRLNEIRKTAER